MWIYVFYVNDTKFKLMDALCVGESTYNRIKKELDSDKRYLFFNPGEITEFDKQGKPKTVTEGFCINMDNVCKVIFDDIN